MRILGQQLEHFVNLVLEPAGQHLVRFVKAENLDVVRPERPTVDHVKHPSGRPDDDVHALLQLRHVLTHVRPADTRMALDVHVVAQRDDDFLDLLRELARGRQDERLGALDRDVQLLQNGDGERRRLARTRLGLRDHVVALHDGDDGALLDRRRPLEPVSWHGPGRER